MEKETDMQLRIKATIKRTTKKMQGYGVTHTTHFVKVMSGHTVRYYPKGATPFHNLYRITSKVGTDDYVIHACNRSKRYG